MNCQLEIQLDLLSQDESQIFFKTKAGISSDFELDDVAKQIVEECRCLPIALETVGAALKGKCTYEWTEVLEKLRNAKLVDIMGVDDDEKNAYKCVKVSYDYLKGPSQTHQAQAQFVLLLCSLFPEDHNIAVEDLTKYAFGMELFERVNSIEDARRKFRVTIQFLKDSCLLLGNGDEEFVKMHDVVRDTMLWIGGTEAVERKVLTVRDNKDLKELIKKKSFHNCRAISFMSDVIPKLSKYNVLECPNLEIVLFFSKGKDVELGDQFFQGTQLLHVLDIKGGNGWTMSKLAMPQSLCSLEYLRTLTLTNCRCSNICVVRDLSKLKILSLNGCVIDGGVEVLSGLKKLRLLDVSKLKAETIMFTSNVIEGFVKLEELYGYEIAECLDEEGTTNSSLSEIMLLSNLVALSIEIEGPRYLPTTYYFPNLPIYCIGVGVDMYGFGLWVDPPRERKHLELRGNIEVEAMLISACKKLLPTVQDLCFKGCEDLRSLNAFNSHADSFLQSLESLEIMECNIMEWMFENASDDTTLQLQSLKILRLEGLTELKRVWKGPTRLLSLGNLTQVDIIRCKTLRSSFTSPSRTTSMQQLEILQITRCPDLEEIISRKGGSHDSSCSYWFTNLREMNVTHCYKVTTIFPMLKSTCLHPQRGCRLSNLQSILLESNYQLEHIFDNQTQVECPSLQVLQVTDCANISITHFFATQLHEEVSSPKPLNADSMNNIEPRQHDDLSHSTFIYSSALRRVHLARCKKLKQVFATSLVTSLRQLEELIVEECDELEKVINQVDDGEEETDILVCFENLKTLKVSKCEKLKAIFPISVALPKLETFELKSNAEMEQMFGQSDLDLSWQSPFLENLCVVGCSKLHTPWIQTLSTSKEMKTIELGDIKGVEELIQLQSQGNNWLVLPLETLSLRNVEELKCIWRGPTHKEERQSVEVGFENLQLLYVSKCEKLTTIFSIFTPLPKLRSLRLEGNEELESLFGKSDCDYTSHWTCLDELSVSCCPKLCTNSVAMIRSQLQPPSALKIINLANMQGVEELIQFQKHDDNDDDEDEYDCDQFQGLRLEEVGDLKRIWSGPTQNISFYYLVALRVIGCCRLKQLFSTTMATTLHSLELLSVERCHGLEHVIGGDQEDGNVETNIQLVQCLNFSRLELLTLIDLPQLISFCPISCNLVFSGLTEDNLKTYY